MSIQSLPKTHIEKKIEENLKDGLNLRKPCLYTRKAGSAWLILLPIGITLLGIALLFLGS